ncbi:hypothetical protein ABB02_00535 [Clostridiaceae bacterium JG1575]|nr:hypothetical protein ABB02_00535 [Clostridiaceae bacterium JG1575]
MSKSHSIEELLPNLTGNVKDDILYLKSKAMQYEGKLEDWPIFLSIGDLIYIRCNGADKSDYYDIFPSTFTESMRAIQEAQTLERLDRSAEAKELLKKKVDRLMQEYPFPENPEDRLICSTDFISLPLFKKMHPEVKKVSLIDDVYSELLSTYAVFLANEEANEAAIRYFEAARTWDPLHLSLADEYAFLLQQVGRWEDSLQLVQDYVKVALTPSDFILCLLGAFPYFVHKKDKEAMKAIRAAVDFLEPHLDFGHPRWTKALLTASRKEPMEYWDAVLQKHGLALVPSMEILDHLYEIAMEYAEDDEHPLILLQCISTLMAYDYPKDHSKLSERVADILEEYRMSFGQDFLDEPEEEEDDDEDWLPSSPSFGLPN